jgi:hypothetical protein
MSFPIVTNSGTSTTAIRYGTGLLYGNVVYFPQTTWWTIARTVSWIVPPGITKVRVRVWGGGGGADYSIPATGGGGGFALKTVTVTPGDAVTVTIGGGGVALTYPGAGGNSSFGGYVSATGGRNHTSTGGIGGAGSGGDINMNGSGVGNGNQRGGNAGNLFISYSGTTADYNQQSSTPLTRMATPENPLDKIGTGYLFGLPPTDITGNNQNSLSGLPVPEVTYFGNGAGGLGTGPQAYGSYPGGGGSYGTGGAAGLVIVEY